jgi:hypothetical protein
MPSAVVSTCLLWCLLREKNDRSSEDRERTLEEIVFFIQNFVSLDSYICFSFVY